MKNTYLFLIILTITSCGQPEKISLDQLSHKGNGYQYRGELYNGIIENKLGNNIETGKMIQGRKEGLWLVISERNDTLKKSNYINGDVVGNVEEFKPFNHKYKLYRTTQLWKDPDTKLMQKEQTTYNYTSNGERFTSSKGMMEGSIKYGSWYEYYPSERKHTHTIYQNGRKNGVTEELFSDYKVRGRYENGKKNGVWMTISLDNGLDRIDTLKKFRNGREIQHLYRQPNELSLKYIKTDEGLEYLCNQHKNYYDSNLLLTTSENAEFYRINYTWGSMDSPVGIVEDYYMNGNRRFVGKISALNVDNARYGTKDGKCIWYFQDGTKQLEATFHIGHLIGKTIFYNPNGSVRKTENHGKLVKSRGIGNLLTDGSRCVTCNSGIYRNGICNFCSSASIDKTLEVYQALENCNLCNGTGWERSRTSNNRGRRCPQCRGAGRITY